MAEVVSLPFMIEPRGSCFRNDLHAADRVLCRAASGALRGFLADGMCAFLVLHWMRPALNLLVLRFGVRRLAAAFPARTPGGPTKSGSKLPHSKRDRAWDRTPRGPTKSGSKLPHSKATAFSNGRRAR